MSIKSNVLVTGEGGSMALISAQHLVHHLHAAICGGLKELRRSMMECMSFALPVVAFGIVENAAIYLVPNDERTR